MGMGKTLECLSLILANPYESSMDILAGTLVIVPVSLLSQWADEVARWAPSLRVVLFYDSAARKRCSNFQLKQADVVLTTYGVVAAEAPSATKHPLSSSSSSSSSFSSQRASFKSTKAKFIKSKKSILFSNCWHRIVLDEAHIIRNR